MHSSIYANYVISVQNCLLIPKPQINPKNTVFDLITAHTPISAQSRNSIAYVVGTHLNCIDLSMQFK